MSLLILICRRRGSSILLCSAIEDGNPKERLGAFAWFHLKNLAGLSRIVVPPEPCQHLGQLRFDLFGTVTALAKAEVEVVVREFESVCKADIVQGPASVLWQLQIVGAILKPHANVSVCFLKNLVGIILATIGHIRLHSPLNAGEAADAADDAAE